MNVEVKLFATFRNDRFKKKVIEFNEKATVEDVLDFLGIKKEDVALIILNGMHSKVDKELKEGDVLALFPPVAGG